jgi:hypothetical protein
MTRLLQTLRQLGSPGGIEGYFAVKYACSNPVAGR